MNATKMNSRGAALIAAVITSVSTLSLITANGNTVNVVDPNNLVQTTLATYGTSSGNWGAFNPANAVVSEATFNLAVGTAYANNLGGVENFEGFSVAQNTAFNIPYPSGPNTLLVAPGPFGATGANESGGRIPISGTTQLWMFSGTGQTGTNFNFNFSLSDPNALLTGIGFDLIDRTNRTPFNNNITVTLTLANGATVTETGVNDVPSPYAPNDIFFGFLVPTNSPIASLSIGTSLAEFNPLDDLGFVTTTEAVPEPSTLALAGAGALLIFCRRKKSAARIQAQATP